MSSFTGVFNHTLLCPDCSSCSSSFEPFTSLLLALPTPDLPVPFIVLLPLSLTGTPMKIMDCFKILEGKLVLEKNENKKEKNEMINNKFDFLRNTADFDDNDDLANKAARSSSETMTKQKKANSLEQFMPHLENLIKCDLGLVPKENLLKFAIWKEGGKLVLDEDICKKEEVLASSSIILVLERPKREIHNRVTIPIVISFREEPLNLPEYNEKPFLPVFKDFENKITISNLFFEVQKEILNLLTIHISQARKDNNIVKSDLGFLLTDLFQLNIRACPLKSDFEVNYCVQCGREGEDGCECFKVGKLTSFNLSKTVKEIYKNKQMLFCKIQFLSEKLSYREKAEMKNFRRPKKIQVSQVSHHPPSFVGSSFFSSCEETNRLNGPEDISSRDAYALKVNDDNTNILNANNDISANNTRYASKTYDSTVTIEKLIENFLEEEILKEENKWVCEKCSRGVEGRKKVRIARKGKVLVVGIGRFGEGKRKRNKYIFYI